MDWSGKPFSFDSLEFRGSDFDVLHRYRDDLLAKVSELQRRVAATHVLGEVLSGDIIAQGRATILYELALRNDSPLYLPIFLTFLDNPHWVKPTDDALLRMKNALARTPKTFRELTRYVQKQPMGGLFELNVYWALDIAFPGAVPQPKVPETKKRSDVMVRVVGREVFVEAAVIGQAEHYRKQLEQMRMLGRRVGGGFGPGPAQGARRIISKIAGELSQMANAVPNILCLSFFDDDPIRPAREWAMADAWNGGKQYGERQDGSRLDLSAVNRVDSIFEFGRKRLQSVHVNPGCLDACRLEPEQRGAIQEALSGDLMIR